MITWIQKTFQQHFRIVFGVLLAGLIVSFIMTIGASPGLGGAQRRTQARPFFGLNLNSAEDHRKLNGDAEMSIILQAGYMPYDDAHVEEYALNRYASLSLADKLGLPAPSQEEITDYIKSLSRFGGESGQFDARKYSEFRDSLTRSGSTAEADASRVLSDDLRFRSVQKLLSGPGYVLPSEAKKQVTIIDTTWTLTVATVDYASFQPKIVSTDAELTKFFADNGFRYTIPAKVNLSYVEFPAARYLGQVNVTEADVRAFYDANPSRFPKPATPEKSPALSAPSPADYALVRPQVEMAVKFERAQKMATKDASDFAVALFERKAALGSPEFNQFLEQHHVALKDLPPFAKDERVAALGDNPQISEEAFHLSAERYFSDALATGSGSVVLFWKSNIPSREPTLAEVHAKVATDAAEEEKRKRFVELGSVIRAQILVHLKAGDTFAKAADAVASANGVKIETKDHPAFSLRQQPKDIDAAVFNQLEHLDKGNVSEFVRSENFGLLVYAADKKLPDLSEKNPIFVQTRAQIAASAASRNAREYTGELVQEELAKTPDTSP